MRETSELNIYELPSRGPMGEFWIRMDVISIDMPTKIQTTSDTTSTTTTSHEIRQHGIQENVSKWLLSMILAFVISIVVLFVLRSQATAYN